MSNASATDMLAILSGDKSEIMTLTWFNGLIGFCCIFAFVTIVFMIVFALNIWRKGNLFKSASTWLGNEVPDTLSSRRRKVSLVFKFYFLKSSEMDFQVRWLGVELREKKKERPVRFWLVGRGRAYAFISYSRFSRLQIV